MIACLDMYQWPESTSAFEGLWAYVRAELRSHGFDAPDHLTPKGEDLVASALSGELILGQVCGITFARCNHPAPIYQNLGALIAADGNIKNGYYTSKIIARDPQLGIADLWDQVFAANSWTSYSGWYALRHHLITAGLSTDLPKTIISGAHRNSVEKVAHGQADWAAIDGISWGMLTRIDPELTSKVVVVDETQTVPGLPLVTSAQSPLRLQQTLLDALAAYFETPQGKADFEAFGIAGFTKIEDAAYADLRDYAGDI